MTQKNEFVEIAKRAKELADSHTTYDPVGHFIGMVIGLGPDCGADTSKLHDVAVPDEWLAAVSALPTISREGLEMLANSMKAQGWVSVATAVKFIECERTHALRDTNRTVRTNAPGEGAAQLLARAEQELPGTIERFTERASEYAHAAKGVLEFGFEKTIWIGSALGLIARTMRNFRKNGNP